MHLALVGRDALRSAQNCAVAKSRAASKLGRLAQAKSQQVRDVELAGMLYIVLEVTCHEPLWTIPIGRDLSRPFGRSTGSTLQAWSMACLLGFLALVVRVAQDWDAFSV